MRDPEDEVTNYCKLINWESMFPNSHAGDFLMKHSRTRTFPCPEGVLLITSSVQREQEGVSAHKTAARDTTFQ